MPKHTKTTKKAAFLIMPLFITLILYLLAASLLFTIGRPIVTALNMFYDAGYTYTSQQSLFKKATRTEGTIPLSQITYPDEGTHYAQIKLPHTDKIEDVYYGDNNDILKKGIGQYMGTTIPGYGTPIMLAGHNNTYFNNLKKIKIGDVIKITTYYGVYEYKVTDTQVRHHNDPSAYDLLQEKEQLILYTCYPFDRLGLTEQRFFVYADKISGPMLVD